MIQMVLLPCVFKLIEHFHQIITCVQLDVSQYCLAQWLVTKCARNDVLNCDLCGLQRKHPISISDSGKAFGCYSTLIAFRFQKVC